MAIERFRLPKLYENMDEATVGQWLVKEGDQIEVGQPLVELITDKTVLEYDSPVSGPVRKILAPPKSVVPIGYILALFGDGTLPNVADENEAMIAAVSQELQAVEAVAVAKPAAKPRARVAPAAKALVKKHGLSIDQLVAAFPSQVIHKRDVEEYLESRESEDEDTPTTETAAMPETLSPDAQHIALITGATGGIGQAIAPCLCPQGLVARPSLPQQSRSRRGRLPAPCARQAVNALLSRQISPTPLPHEASPTPCWSASSALTCW